MCFRRSISGIKRDNVRMKMLRIISLSFIIKHFDKNKYLNKIYATNKTSYSKL